MLLTPSLMILSTPSLRLSTAMVWVARISTASGVAKAGIIPRTPLSSLAVIIGHLHDSIESLLVTELSALYWYLALLTGLQRDCQTANSRASTIRRSNFQ